jgi:PAS domain S-box-containing protein
MPVQPASTATPESSSRRVLSGQGAARDSGETTSLAPRRTRLDLWIPAVYALLSCAWIAVSDRLIAVLARSTAQQANWGTLKGFGFVAVTAVLLHAGLRWALARERSAHRRVAEQLALRDQFAKVASSVPGAIISFRLRPDGAGAVTFATPAVEELFGISGHALAEDIATWAANVHPDDARLVNDAVAKAARTVSRWHLEYRYLHPGKGLRWIEGWADPTAEPDGSILWHGLVMDVTERKAIEEERKRADEALRRLGAAVEQTPASIVITDETGAIEYVNPAFERTTGYTAAEVLGRTPSVIKSGAHEPEFYRRLWETIRSGRVWSGRIVNRARNGTLFTEDAVIAPVKDASGVVRNYVAVKRDVTEELKLQNQLFEAQKLESIARLAGGIAHDFNNLLTVILGCAAALRDDLASGRPASAEDVEEVRTAGERARELTRQLLAFARRQVIEPVALDLNALIGNSEKLLRRVLNEDIVLEVAVQPHLWPVRCDPGQLEQILLNLVVNARDAMAQGGKLRIETSNQEVTEAHVSLYPGIRPGPYVRLAIHDSGAGMSAEVKARLFEPFFTTKPVGEGTGLGLATVHGIVKQSGGFIRVESEPGYGTSFEVLFPRAGEAARRAPEPAAHTPRRGGETVLLVEDDPHVRSVTARALGSEGYAVLVAGNGLEALELLSSHRGPLDLLVTDVIMPGVDGHRLAESIRKQWPKVRVLYVSGHAHDVLGEHGALDPGVDLLSKPYTPASLLARVAAALTRQAPG